MAVHQTLHYCPSFSAELDMDRNMVRFSENYFTAALTLILFVTSSTIRETKIFDEHRHQ